ncbi:hypothetical protein [Kribbella solani]|uniref:Sugar-specific transcriptional regulator TrmB n=1 Tax=Kribbella solani TaxID=236067 RepID=A0A841DYE1_9ACTN|nr:hypothetical protein [Kribbella solani]MBB5983593.1 sugar-specific transcriptional regulator TrmB [Kribbella solani]
MGDLTALGLTRAEEDAYSALVASGPHPSENAVLNSLVSKGLVSRVDDHYVAVAPDIALEVLLLEQERRLRDARVHIDDLSSAYRTHTGTPTATMVELVTGAGAVQQRIEQVQLAARTEVRRLVKTPYRAPASLLPECRTVYEHGVLDAQDNETARVLPALPINLYVADDRLALVLLNDRSAVLVQPCGLFDAYVELFEALWERALPVKADGAETLVALLLAGLTDEALARQLGVSSRTAQRKIAALMQELGARTRFQAGAQTAMRDLG